MTVNKIMDKYYVIILMYLKQETVMYHAQFIITPHINVTIIHSTKLTQV